MALEAQSVQAQRLSGIDPEVISILRLGASRIPNCSWPPGVRENNGHAFATELGISDSGVLGLVRLSDLVRLPGVKGTRARPYLDAGVGSAEKMANCEPEPLRLMVTEYVERTGFGGIPPLPKEVSSRIANARKLLKVVEF